MLRDIVARPAATDGADRTPTSEYFGINTFSLQAMRENSFHSGMSNRTTMRTGGSIIATRLKARLIWRKLFSWSSRAYLLIGTGSNSAKVSRTSIHNNHLD
jgi:hypothetical protein